MPPPNSSREKHAKAEGRAAAVTETFADPPANCPFCGEPYEPDGPDRPADRMAFDAWKGRLWAVCADCRRWTPVPLEARWEILEECERAVREEGKVLLASEHLSLVRVGARELVRMGEPPEGHGPTEFGGWRYGERLPAARQRQGFWRRLLGSFLRLPDPPPGGYDPYGFGVIKDPSIERAWFASPFLEHASRLTYAFGQLPLAPHCPSCGEPVLLLPWHFQTLRWERSSGVRGLEAPCARCRTDVFLAAAEARPALRLGLALVTPEARSRPVAEAVVAGLEQRGGGSHFLDRVVSERRELGDLDLRERVALTMVLDRDAELEALEAEWRRAEEISAIMDGELTRVPGFEAFRQRILGESGEHGGPG